jgi:hypothetical protein
MDGTPTELTDAVSKALNLMARLLANAPVVDAQLIEMWTVVLEARGITAADVARAAGIVAGQERFFPQPSVFIDAVRPTGDEDAALELGWVRVLECVRRFGGYSSLNAADVDGDTAALWAVDRMGWVRLCSELGDDNRSLFRAEFVRFYRLARQERAACAYVAGRLELENAARRSLIGELTPAMCGRPDWESREALPAKPPVVQALPAVPEAAAA